MSFQAHKTFVNLRNTNEDIFDEIRELSGRIDSKATDMFKAQQDSKDIVKIVHDDISGSNVILWSYVCKSNKNNNFIQQFLLFRVSLWCMRRDTLMNMQWRLSFNIMLSASTDLKNILLNFEVHYKSTLNTINCKEMSKLTDINKKYALQNSLLIKILLWLWNAGFSVLWNNCELATSRQSS